MSVPVSSRRNGIYKMILLVTIIIRYRCVLKDQIPHTSVYARSLTGTRRKNTYTLCPSTFSVSIFQHLGLNLGPRNYGQTCAVPREGGPLSNVFGWCRKGYYTFVSGLTMFLYLECHQTKNNRDKLKSYVVPKICVVLISKGSDYYKPSPDLK